MDGFHLYLHSSLHRLVKHLHRFHLLGHLQQGNLNSLKYMYIHVRLANCTYMYMYYILIPLSNISVFSMVHCQYMHV